LWHLPWELTGDRVWPNCSIRKTGKIYLCKGNGTDELERVLLVSNKPNTVVLSMKSNSVATLSWSYMFWWNQFIDGNYMLLHLEMCLLINVLGYTSPANQNLFFVPPINCATPNLLTTFHNPIYWNN
jgi:hypothetical protein